MGWWPATTYWYWHMTERHKLIKWWCWIWKRQETLGLAVVDCHIHRFTFPKNVKGIGDHMMVLVLSLEEAGDNGIKLLVLAGEAASASASAWLLPPALHRCLPCFPFQSAQPKKYPIICSPLMWRNPIFSTIIDINYEILHILNQRRQALLRKIKYVVPSSSLVSDAAESW